MSALGQMILKHAEARRVDTERVKTAGVRFAEAYLRAQEKLASMSQQGWQSFADAVAIGRQKAAAEAPALLVLEKHGELQIPFPSPCEAADEEVAVFAAAAAEKLAESVDAQELANPDVQEAIVHIAMDLAQHAATAGLLPVPADDNPDGEDDEGGNDGPKDEGKKDDPKDGDPKDGDRKDGDRKDPDSE